MAFRVSLAQSFKLFYIPAAKDSQRPKNHKVRTITAITLPGANLLAELLYVKGKA